MLDAVDKVIKSHIRNLLSVGGRTIPVFSIATADQDDQPFTQAGLANEKKPDRIDLPFVSLTRLPAIHYTDYNQTKRVHNYTGYEAEGVNGIALTYDRCTLNYTATVFAENRKVSEDLATALFSRLRNNCQIRIGIQLPVESKDETSAKKTVVAEMQSDIVLGEQIEQVNQQGLDKAQLYKARVSFEVRNVNIYNFVHTKSYTYRIIFSTSFDQEGSPRSEEVLWESVSE